MVQIDQFLFAELVDIDFCHSTTLPFSARGVRGQNS
jgi:hypothetical protein